MKADEVELKSTINLALISEDEDLDLIPDEAAIGPDSFDIVAIAISSMRRERGRERERGHCGVGTPTGGGAGHVLLVLFPLHYTKFATISSILTPTILDVEKRAREERDSERK